MAKETISFTIKKDGSTKIHVHSTEGKCVNLSQDIIEALSSAFEAESLEAVNEDQVKEEVAVTQINTK